MLFLHGHWDQPDSVVLDERSYQEIARDKEYREKFGAVWLTSTWIYVECHSKSNVPTPPPWPAAPRFARRCGRRKWLRLEPNHWNPDAAKAAATFGGAAVHALIEKLWAKKVRQQP